MTEACPDCLRRAWLLARLGGHLEQQRAGLEELLTLPDRELIEAVAGRRRNELDEHLAGFDASLARRRCRRARLATICRCQPRYPASLLELDAPPAVLHIAGDPSRLDELLGRDPVAIVGARKASPYGIDIAHALGRGLSASGVTVISGMANGIDTASHKGALASGGRTIAVLPAGADRPYPPAQRQTLARIRSVGAAISELPPGSEIWRWTFPARNRIIAALSRATVVVEAKEGSGALLTAAMARRLGRALAAVPGRVTAPLSTGPNALIASGATLVRDAQDVLDLLFGPGGRAVTCERPPPLHGALAELASAIGSGLEASQAFEQLGLDADAGLAALADLELGGYIRREPGGRFALVP